MHSIQNWIFLPKCHKIAVDQIETACDIPRWSVCRWCQWCWSSRPRASGWPRQPACRRPSRPCCHHPPSPPPDRVINWYVFMFLHAKGPYNPTQAFLMRVQQMQKRLPKNPTRQWMKFRVRVTINTRVSDQDSKTESNCSCRIFFHYKNGKLEMR